MTEEQKTQQVGELKLPSVQQLLEAGVHFGHRTSKWNPKMDQYIFGARNNVHIFDLEKSLKKLEEAIIFLQGVVAKGGTIIFVGTKPAAKKIIMESAQALNQPHVAGRWLGGTLTNFKTISKRLSHFREMEEQSSNGAWIEFIKKERLMLQRELDKLRDQLEGIKNLMKLPDAIFVADVKNDNLAIREAKRVGVPVVAICDTSVDPSMIDYVIPANDDASSALKLIMDTVVENLKDVKPVKLAEEKMEK